MNHIGTFQESPFESPQSPQHPMKHPTAPVLAFDADQVGIVVAQLAARGIGASVTRMHTGEAVVVPTMPQKAPAVPTTPTPHPSVNARPSLAW